MGVIQYGGRSILATVFFCLLGSLTGIQAHAGSFTVLPVRIYMTPTDRAYAVTVTNDGDTELVMQAELFKWGQSPDGKDILTPTEDVFLSPPILKIKPQARQVVRLARLTAAPPKQQLTYRMITREVPEALNPSDKQVVQVALAYNMPIFITPRDAKPNLGCMATRTAPDIVEATCKNTGNAHTHPVTLQLLDAKGNSLARNDTGGYILSGIKRSFPLKQGT